MANQDFTSAILVDQTPEIAFNAINNVRGWWSEELEGNSEKLNDEFVYHFHDVHYCQMKLIEVIPNKKVVWFVKYNYFKFTKDRSEWTGSTISFDISNVDGKTEVRMTHYGLGPELECFSICSSAWSQYIQGSLFKLITTGNGTPNNRTTALTEDEKKFISKDK